MANEDTTMMDVEKYLSGAEFPADKQKLIKFAKDKGATGEIMKALNSLPNREFTNTADVESEMGE